MLATKAAALRNVNRCAQCRSDEVASLAVVRRVPVLGLVLELLPHRPPANGCARSEPMLTCEPCHLPSPCLDRPSIMVAGEWRLVMNFFHVTLAELVPLPRLDPPRHVQLESDAPRPPISTHANHAVAAAESGSRLRYATGAGQLQRVPQARRARRFCHEIGSSERHPLYVVDLVVSRAAQ